MARPCFIMDLDGTLCDSRHRLHYVLQTPKDWKGWYGNMALDLPNPRVMQMARSLVESQLHMVIVTARQDHVLLPTLQWLKAHDAPMHSDILMRDRRDHRDDGEVKADLVQRMTKDMGYAPTLAFEDRDHLVALYRQLGIPTIHVNEEWYD